MLNQVVAVGRLVRKPELKELEDGKSVSNITIAVPRSYKNADGEYDTDFVDCTLWEGIAKNAVEYCEKGDLVGIKGKIQTDLYEIDNETIKSTKVIVEKLTYLSSSKEKNQPEQEM